LRRIKRRAKTGSPVGLPAGFQLRHATADGSKDQLVRSIVDRYLGPSDPEASTSSVYRLSNEDNMSIVGVASPTPREKRVRDRESLSDSDMNVHPIKGRKVLRSLDLTVRMATNPLFCLIRLRKLPEKCEEEKPGLEDWIDWITWKTHMSLLTFTDCPTHLAYEDLNSKDVDEIAVSDGWLNDVETVRYKSKKIKIGHSQNSVSKKETEEEMPPKLRRCRNHYWSAMNTSLRFLSAMIRSLSLRSY